jgi:hypothetical protein
MKPHVLATVVAVSRLALADPAPDPATLFHQGQASYDQQRYDDALAAWEQSYALSHLPALLYNIAQAYRLRDHAGDCALARADYAKFVELSPPSSERELASRYVAQLATCAAPRDEPDAAIASPPISHVAASSPQARPPQRFANGRSIAGVAIGVVGVGLLVTGVALGHHASVLGDDVTHACSVSCDWSGEMARDAAGRRDAAAGWALDGVGAAALVGSAVVLYLGVNERGVAVVPTSSMNGATVVWSRGW